MKRFYQMFVALALVALGATSVSAQERIPFDAEHFTFHSYNGWDEDATETGTFAGNFILEQADGCPIGDTGCNAWVDLTNYTKMYVQMEGCDAEGNPNGSNPRMFINRLTSEGQFNADRTIAKCLVIPNDGTWAADYYTKDGDILVIDLKKIAKDFGFVHFHSIKGSAYNTKAIVHSIEVEKPANKQPVGWTSIINNGNFEGDDFSSFVLALQADSGDGDKTYASDDHVTEGVGASESKALVVQSMANAPQTWSTQLFVKLGEPVTEGLRWRFSMDVKADAAAHVTTGSHAAPRAWIGGGIIPEFDVTTDWQTITAEGEITKDLADKAFGSIAFDLNNDKVNANTFYFDNIKFDVYKLGTTASFSNDVVLVDFGFGTNIPELVKAAGKPRLMYPNDCVVVKVNGQAAEIYSVEAFADGRFYIFLNEGVESTDEVQVSFTNPTDAAYHLIYADGSVKGTDVKNFQDLAAAEDGAIEDNGGYPYDYLTPVIVKADPENGSFNLPNSISEFKVTFDKEVNCESLAATLNGTALTIEPATGFATEFTLKREGADLATGEYLLNITKIYPKEILGAEVFGDTTLVLNVGKPEYDPEDVSKEFIADQFNAAANGAIPEGFFVKFGNDERAGGTTWGSGSRMFDFGAGGDFTKGFYFREGYIEYGSTQDYPLTLEAGKKYQIHFNTAMWKDNGASTRFEIIRAENEEIVLVKVVANKPNVNGSTAAVNGSAVTDFSFIPEATGNYIVRWTSSGQETGAPGFMEIILGNPSLKYIPNQAGIESVQLLDAALANAKSTRDANTGERYAGADFQALTAAIEKYEAEKEGYTNPSVYEAAAADLAALSDAVKNHRTLCDDYDKSIKKAIDVVRQVSADEDNGKPNARKKFMKHELFTQLTALVEKYHGSSQWVDVADHSEEDPGNPVPANMQLAYTYDVLCQNDSLSDAVAELTTIANTTSKLFTAGESKTGSTGVMAQVERLRRGALTLKSLGMAADDALIVAADNAITDDDELAETIKKNIAKIVYEQLKNPETTIFDGVTNEQTLEMEYPKYDMSVFFKNPNIYALQQNKGVNAENVPGWEVPTNNGEITIMWTGGPYNIAGVAEDCAFTKYHGATRMQQTVTDLPAGVYDIVIDADEWSNEFAAKETDTPEQIADKEAKKAKGFVFAKTSETAEPLDGEEESREAHFAKTLTIEHVDGGHRDHILEGVAVVDGLLTVGVNFGPDAQYMFDQIKAVYLTAAANGVNYTDLYNEAVTGIDGTEVAPAKVRAIEMFDLNGRRVAKAQKGLVIVKKYLSNGTVKAEKVVVK